MLLGHFTLLIEFMSASFWVPLARLTLAAYLMHMVVMYTLFYGDKASYYYSG
jgi:hypothetical protein